MNLTKKALTFIVAFLFISTANTFTQKIDLEKTHEITGKSKRGNLLRVDRNDQGDYKLTYITKISDNIAKVKIKGQIYTFDKDFNFKDFEEVEVSEKKYFDWSWGIYKGEDYSVEGNKIANLPGMALKLKKKRTNYKYSWFYFDYVVESREVLDVVKPRTDEGDKYIVKFSYNAPIGSPGPKAASIEDEQTGDLYFLAGIRNKKIMSKDFDPNEEHTDLHLLKFNKDLDLVGDLPIQFEYPQEVVYVRAVSASIDGKDEQDVGGGVIIFAPANLRGNKDFKRDPEINNFTFVHFDDECNLVSRVSFKPEIVGWNIDEAVVNKSEDEYEFYVYGPAALGKDDYWLKTYQKGKYKAVQVMKIKGGEVAYLTQTELPEFEAKMETPPAQKSGEVYEGKKFSRSGFAVSSNGDYYIMGQNIAKSDGPIYGNALCFHFNDEGKLKAQYSVEPHEKPKYSYKIDQAMKEINEDMFWIWIESAEENLFFPTIGKVKIDEGKVQNFLRMGMDEKGKKQEYFLNPKFPYLNIEDNQTVFFGNDEKGKNIWFCRVKFE